MGALIAAAISALSAAAVDRGDRKRAQIDRSCDI
jgi:hypothetical protein